MKKNIVDVVCDDEFLEMREDGGFSTLPGFVKVLDLVKRVSDLRILGWVATEDCDRNTLADFFSEPEHRVRIMRAIIHVDRVVVAVSVNSEMSGLKVNVEFMSGESFDGDLSNATMEYDLHSDDGCCEVFEKRKLS